LRLDLFLKHVCLAKSRSMAAKAVEGDKVRVNGARVKPSREVREGDVIEITSRALVRKIKVLRVPEKQVAKAAAADYYEILDESRLLDEAW